MDEWFKEICGIKEKTRPSKEAKTIPVPGEWHVGIYVDNVQTALVVRRINKFAEELKQV